MQPRRYALLALLALGFLRPPEARAQDILPALVGGATGLVAGGYVSIGIVTFQARRGEYLYSTDDALGWHASPILVGSGVGFMIGLLDQERLRRTVIGGAAGGAAGTAVGVLLGLRFWDPPEGKWAGGVIGGAAGLLLGSIVGVLWRSEDGGEEAPTDAARIPIGVRISF